MCAFFFGGGSLVCGYRGADCDCVCDQVGREVEGVEIFVVLYWGWGNGDKEGEFVGVRGNIHDAWSWYWSGLGFSLGGGVMGSIRLYFIEMALLESQVDSYTPANMK